MSRSYRPTSGRRARPDAAPARFTVARVRRAAGLLAAALCCAVAPAAAIAATAPSVGLHATFTPDRLNAPTTIGFQFTIAREEGHAPPPLTHAVLRMPAGLSYATSTLGLAICQPATLEKDGLSGCSPNSRLGHGSASVEVPFGTGAGHEIPDIEAVMGPPHNGNVEVLFYANGRIPIFAQLVFGGELLTGSGPYGMVLDTSIPLVPSVTNGPPVSILRVASTIGPNQLTYYKRVHGRRVAYHPRGIEVPEHCPKGGFPFEAEFTFQDGSQATATTAVPCPPRRRRRHK